jgi:magnesium chelatase subunit D
MTEPSTSDVLMAARLLAIDHLGLGGAALTCAAGADWESWLAVLVDLLPAGLRVQRLPSHVPEDRLLGGIDLAATKALGKTVVEPGLLTRTSGGLLLLPFAERADERLTAHIAAVLDDGVVRLERDGIAARLPAELAVIAICDGRDGEGSVAGKLLDRLAFDLRLDQGWRGAPSIEPDEGERVAAARARLPNITVPDPIIEALTTAAVSLGVASLRAPILAVKVARAHAAYAGRTEVAAEDAAVAARLLLAPRATQMPSDPQASGEDADGQSSAPTDSGSWQDADVQSDESGAAPTEVVLAAAAAALPGDLLQVIARSEHRRARAAGQGSGQRQRSMSHGRRVGHLAGRPHSGARLDLVATLRSAAPWQELRRLDRARNGAAADAGRALIDIRPSDFRISRYQKRMTAVTVFVVDASGSTALSRLAEAKGAVELLLAECYVRRDRVALIAFRRQGAELILPPTRSLTRAKRVLAHLAGGGATPLAAGLRLAQDVIRSVSGRDQSVICVVLTDGRPNIASDGTPGRAQAQTDALLAAKALSGAGASVVLIDTSPRPNPFAAELAAAMSALYRPLPDVEATALSRIAREVDQRRQNRTPPDKTSA